MRGLPALVLISLLFGPLAYADDQQQEIDHLLGYLADSGCTYIRNGSEHSAGDAVAHIRKKQRYFANRIDSSERFIELSASQSTMTGKVYMIRCPGQDEQSSQSWLLAELARYRAQEKEQ
ncbi:MAG: DUF5329 domain-containing protein [Halieaceae bacterium]